jgi:hypothetical protein
MALLIFVISEQSPMRRVPMPRESGGKYTRIQTSVTIFARHITIAVMDWLRSILDRLDATLLRVLDRTCSSLISGIYWPRIFLLAYVRQSWSASWEGLLLSDCSPTSFPA